MANRPNTTCDHYGFDRETMKPTCAAGHMLATMRCARVRGCVRGHAKDGGTCPDRDDAGQEARDAEVIRVTDAMLAGQCPECGSKLDTRETDLNLFSWCPKCPNVSARGCKRAAIGEAP